MITAEFSVAAGRAWSVVAARLPLRFETPSGPAVLDLGAADAPADWHRIDLHLSGLVAGLAVRPDLLPPAAAQWPEATEAALPAALHEVLLEILFDDLAGLLQGWCGERPLWAPAAAGALPHHLAITCAGRPAAALQLDDAGLAWLARQLQSEPALWLDVEALPVACELLLEQGGVTLGELRDAAPGDVTLLDGADAPSVMRVAGGPAWRVRHEPGRLTLLQPLDTLMDNAAPPLTADFDALLLPVEFVAGRLDLPISRLRELAPGQVLDLGLDASPSVSLRVNGQVVATGELVKLGDRSGIRLTAVHLARS